MNNNVFTKKYQTPHGEVTFSAKIGAEYIDRYFRKLNLPIKEPDWVRGVTRRDFELEATQERAEQISSTIHNLAKRKE